MGFAVASSQHHGAGEHTRVSDVPLLRVQQYNKHLVHRRQLSGAPAAAGVGGGAISWC
jgi:hypothetical protein